MDWIRVSLFGLGALAIITSVIPIWRTTRWWVRICDFPRFQIGILALVVLLTTAILRPPIDLLDYLFLTSLIAVTAWQATWVGPYLPGAPRPVKTCQQSESSSRIAVLTTNVLQESRGAPELIEIIREADPDLVLTVEVDEWWARSLSDGLTSNYPYKVCYPLSNGYGLALFSRLELIRPEVRFIFDEAIPSLRTDVRLHSGAVITVYAVHPRPPAIMQDSKERDMELVRLAVEIKKTGAPAIVVGDLNDVAWSPTTLTFVKSGDLLDPRRGRGFYNTYPARWPGLRYPLDYVFNTKHFDICSMKVLPAFGSDHLPLIAELNLRAD